jgi:uncharacterized membrane protein YbaN (DUF454 family)
MTPAKRIGLIVVGLVSLALGGLGIVVPLLPTTPFVLVAAFAFANSSDKLHQWLLDHNVFGPLIDNWRRHRAISRTAKAMSVGCGTRDFLVFGGRNACHRCTGPGHRLCGSIHTYPAVVPARLRN